MKFYILCDIEGVAALSKWDDARTSGPDYPAMAREMSLEAACTAQGILADGGHEVIVEDGHGDGCNIDCALLPDQIQLIRGVTHEIFGKTGPFDESFDGLFLVGFHSAAGTSCNPTAHTVVSSRVYQLQVNGTLWGEMEIFSHAASYRGVPTLLVSGDAGVCEAARHLIPGVCTLPTKSGCGYGVMTKTPQRVQTELRQLAQKAVHLAGSLQPPALPSHFHVELTYIHHYDAYGCSHYPGANLISPTTLAFDSDDYGEVLRFLYFVI